MLIDSCRLGLEQRSGQVVKGDELLIHRLAGGVGTLQVEYARRPIEERVGDSRPGCVGSVVSGYAAGERKTERSRCRGRMAIREGARADGGGWEEGAMREGMAMRAMASPQARE